MIRSIIVAAALLASIASASAQTIDPYQLNFRSLRAGCDETLRFAANLRERCWKHVTEAENLKLAAMKASLLDASVPDKTFKRVVKSLFDTYPDLALHQR
jgi:hypothetical protein